MDLCAARMTIALCLTILFIGAPGASSAIDVYEKDEFKIKLSGHLQELSQSTEDPVFKEHVTTNTGRARATLRMLTGTMLTAEASLDATYTFGSVLESRVYQLVKDQPPPTYFNWEHTYVDTEARHGTLSVYRAHLTFEGEKARAVLGRQRLAYGTALFWSPVDIWNPVSPLALEPEERHGVDGVSGIWWISREAKVTALGGLAHTWEEASVAASGALQIKSYTFDVIAGKRGKDHVYGADFVGYIKDAGVRGEFTWTVADKSDDYPRAVLGMDYAFENSLYLAAEYYYNGGPIEIDPANPFDALFESSGVDTFNRNFLGCMINYQFTPLISPSVTGIWDIDEGSWVAGPGFEWWAANNVTISGGGQVFGGSRNGEYGGYADLAWVRIRVDY